ncbi:oxidoreductase C-terminal domain-containing protein [Streptomyces indonesiensis]
MFWSDQYDCKLQLVGHPRPGDLVSVTEGDLTRRRCVVVYSRAGRMTAALLVNSPHRLRAYREAVTAATPVVALARHRTPLCPTRSDDPLPLPLRIEE